MINFVAKKLGCDVERRGGRWFVFKPDDIDETEIIPTTPVIASAVRSAIKEHKMRAKGKRNLYHRIYEKVLESGLEKITIHDIKGHYEEVHGKPWVDRTTGNRILRAMEKGKLIRFIGREGKTKAYAIKSKYNPYVSRPEKNKLRNKLTEIFNEFVNDGERVTMLETEKFNFIDSIKKQIVPIIGEKDTGRFLLMCKRRPELDIRLGDIDKKILGNQIEGSSHFFLDYCDTFDNHVDTIKHIANHNVDDGKIFAMTFAMDRRFKERTGLVNSNQVARAIKIIQEIFRRHDFEAQLLEQETYKDGFPMNTICFKINRVYRKPVVIEKKFTAEEIIKLMGRQ